MVSKLLEQQADEFLKQHGYDQHGKPINVITKKETLDTNGYSSYINTILSAKDNLPKRKVTGSFASRRVKKEELSHVLDIHSTTSLSRRLHTLLIPYYMMNGWGVYRYKIIKEYGIYLALYKLQEGEKDKYKQKYYSICRNVGLSHNDLIETKRLYSIDEWEKTELVEGGHVLVYKGSKVTKTAINEAKRTMKRIKKELY